MYNLKGSFGLSARFCKENITVLNVKIGLIYHLGRIFCMLLVLVLVNLLCRLLLFGFFFLSYNIFLFIVFLKFTVCVLFFFLALNKYLFLCIRCSTLTLGRTRGGGGMPPPPPPYGFSEFSPRG